MSAASFSGWVELLGVLEAMMRPAIGDTRGDPDGRDLSSRTSPG